MTVEIKGIGKVTANQEVLNLLSILASEAADHYRENERYALAKEAQKTADYIYCSLKEAGAYN